MNLAVVVDLIAVREGVTTDFMRSACVGARAGDARMRQRGRGTNLYGLADVSHVVGIAEVTGRSGVR